MFKKNLTFIIFNNFFFKYCKVYSIEPDVFVQSTVNRAAKTLSGNLQRRKNRKT